MTEMTCTTVNILFFNKVIKFLYYNLVFTGTRITRQKLYFNGNKLKDDKKLSDYKITEGSTLKLKLKFCL